jgi:hypothetical protein
MGETPGQRVIGSSLTTRQPWRVAALIVLLAGACRPTPSGDELDHWIARHTEARGGGAAIEAVHAVEIELEIEEPTFKVRGHYVATRAGQMRIDIFADGERVFTEAFDGERGWELAQGQAVGKEASEKGNAALQHGIEFPFKLFGLHELPSRGHRLELLGRERIDGINYIAVGLTLADGFHVTYYIDPTTALISRSRERRALHVDVDPTEQLIESRYEDYRRVAGVLYPFRQVATNLANGQWLSRDAVLAMKVNPTIDPQVFQRPQ